MNGEWLSLSDNCTPCPDLTGGNYYGLALHTSSPQLGLSLSNFAGDTRCQSWHLERDLAAYLHQYLRDFLPPQTWQDLAFVAVARGPGSFTSTRIGLVTARTLAQQLKIPLFAISSLAAWAWSERDRFPANSLIAVQMAATRGQLYGGIYLRQAAGFPLVAHLPDALLSPTAWQQVLSELPLPYQCLDVPALLGYTAPSLLELAYGDWQQGKRPHWAEALPFYGN